jgi:hypothetical protein
MILTTLALRDVHSCKPARKAGLPCFAVLAWWVLAATRATQAEATLKFLQGISGMALRGNIHALNF